MFVFKKKKEKKSIVVGARSHWTADTEMTQDTCSLLSVVWEGELFFPRQSTVTKPTLNYSFPFLKDIKPQVK